MSGSRTILNPLTNLQCLSVNPGDQVTVGSGGPRRVDHIVQTQSVDADEERGDVQFAMGTWKEDGDVMNSLFRTTDPTTTTRMY